MWSLIKLSIIPPNGIETNIKKQKLATVLSVGANVYKLL